MLDVASLGGIVQALNITQCQSLAAMLEAAHSRLLQDIESSLVDLPSYFISDQMRTNINKINKTSPKFMVEQLAKLGFRDLSDLK